jgi:hypothetical protein
MKIDLTNNPDFTIHVEVERVPALSDCFQFKLVTEGAEQGKSYKEIFLSEQQLKTLAAFLEVYCSDEFRLGGLFND